MDKEKFTNELKKILSQEKLKNLIAICLILAFILIAMSVLMPSTKKLTNKGMTVTNEQANATTDINSQQESYEEQQKIDLKNILKKMDGVGDVDVMISFENGEEKVPVYDKNDQISTTQETDNAGGKRVNNQNTNSSKVVMTTNDGKNEPFIIKTNKPRITGIVVVAEGAENSKTKYQIEQAVSKLYNLTLDKVNVYSMKK